MKLIYYLKSHFTQKRGGAELRWLLPESEPLLTNPEKVMYQINDITGAIITESINIHKELGPGLLESVYEQVLARSLQQLGFFVERQKSVTFKYHDLCFIDGFRADLLVENQVVVEIKSIERIAPVHPKQVLTYLRLMNLHVGLLINFGEATLKDGLHRIVNNYQPSTVTE